MSNTSNNGTGFWLIVGLIVVMSLVAVAEAGGKLVLASARKVFASLPLKLSRTSARAS